ncbi:nuclear fragile X mental retardation-interacting protein 1 [Anopheles funestus]|uniref:nuclear fragile X mental retardation-interacting protein 1 n=1 Tax=Anopheles funestus TaxID=62324 RepID=UPI0020C73629|nr:nuclear fragile X mental retardation-interacting protein 1 [Anopheles funestus]
MAEEKFLLPPPKFKEEVQKGLDNFSRHLNPHFSTPHGMLLTRDKQPPPMYGPRGSTVPPRFLANSRKRPAGWTSTDRGNNQQMQPGGFQNNYRPRFKHASAGGKNQSIRPPNNGFDKEVKPELLVLDWKLWCEGCDVNCRSEVEYQQHISNHAPCSVPGCKFVGHPMIMKRHDRQAHQNDAKAKDSVGPSSEEIEQWKEERRKRYPTKQNVILRQHAQEARFNRGERIEESKDRFPNRHLDTKCESRENGPWREMASKGRNNKRSKRRKRSAASVAVTIAEENTGRIPFKGTSTLKDYKDPSASALAMLGDYGSGSENESDVEEEIVNTVNTNNLINDSVVQPENVLSEGEIIDDEEANNTDKNLRSDLLEQPAIDTQDNPVSTSVTTVPKQQAADVPDVTTPQTPEKSILAGSSSKANATRQHNSKQGHKFKGKKMPQPNRPLLDYSKLRRSNQNTMLEKLLDSDIRHERNVLLQCVRHVLANKFFGIGEPNEANPAAVSDDAKE